MSSTDKKRVVFVKFDGLVKGKEGELFLEENDEATDMSSLDNDWNSTGDTTGESRRPLREAVRDDIYEREYESAPGAALEATFTRRDVCRLFDVSDGRLKYWDKTEFISPGGYRGQRRCYTFQDLISIRSAIALLDNGVTLQKTRAMIAQLRRLLPQTTHPLSRLRISGDSNQVTVTEEGREFEAASGQMLIDFTVKNLEEDLVSHLPDYALKRNSRTAYEWYLAGCDLDECDETLDDAEHAYHQALLLDPSLATAYTNLGNLRYRRGAMEDSRALYEKALEVDDAQPEAHYNLGFLDYEAGALHAAESHFARAVELDDTFADAYFNLAMTEYRLGKEQDACRLWQNYLTMAPRGDWADIARQRLAEMQLESCHESH
ncbi:MAG: tetratricopeptide repeat protein [Deltaproteobacteria bacterium]|nr:tetratricopeptide repeat protein [Deltaproteobacteria bacterium]